MHDLPFIHKPDPGLFNDPDDNPRLIINIHHLPRLLIFGIPLFLNEIQLMNATVFHLLTLTGLALLERVNRQ